MELESCNKAIGYPTIYCLSKKHQWSCHLSRKGKRYRQRQGVEAGACLMSGSERGCRHWEVGG
ncbi:MAG: hypothetical protein QS748_14205 [Candidatus Endonucleobacter bathymodioli]|uniref:Uncharacterized protein n=1 Tax=Candidatus Endonucleibacter bathymodioli TaxID=539814 RepID=A0AA90NVV7_9GAMM|nr:hypothetical protein [Candidatus Endonucleobacter bathymodioli]